MRKIILLTSGILCSTFLFAQNIQQVLESVESNNLALKSAYQFKEADIRAERTTNNLSNPDAEASYQWGKPGELGNKQTFTATQTFDFPSTYYYRNKTIGHRIAQREAEYNQQRVQILLEARNLCIELIYLNQLYKEFTLREEQASLLYISIKRQYDLGAVNQLDLNKARLNQINASAEKSKIDAERNGKQILLNQLNGGIPVSISEEDFPTPEVPADFAQWYQTSIGVNPYISAADQQVQAALRNLHTSKSNGLPKIKLGYTMEHLADELFQGAVFGISIPLWENRNQVKQAKARKFASEYQMNDITTSQRSYYADLYQQLVQQQANCQLYRETLHAMSDEKLLLKAYQKGELSLLEYLMELTYYYDTKTKALELYRDFNLTYNAFNKLYF